jgi:TPR repeat protein
MNTVKSGILCAVLCFLTVLPCVAGAQHKPEEKTYRDLIAAYEKGDTSAAYNIAMDYYHGIDGAPFSYPKAMEWFKKAAVSGNDLAMVKLGDMYSSGEGVKTNDREAFKWYSKAADKGIPEGQEKLGDIYYNGEGQKQNYIQAEKWYRKAAEKETDPEPCSQLGKMYLLGDGVKKDYSEALKWYLKADELGDNSAAVFIADIYQAGQVIQKNPAKAAEWLKKGAAAGDTVAMTDLAKAYLAGDGVPLDNTEAYGWLSVVTGKDNNSEAESLLAQTAQKMTPDELSNAKEQASALVEKYVTPEDRDKKAYLATLPGK